MITALIIYGVLSILYLLINQIFNGYTGESWSKKDFIDAIFWPIMLCILFGMFIRIIHETKKSRDKSINKSKGK